MPWSELLALIALRAPATKTGRPRFDLAMMLRIHCLRQWFGLSDLGAEEAFFGTSFYRDCWCQRYPAHSRKGQHSAV